MAKKKLPKIKLGQPIKPPTDDLGKLFSADQDVEQASGLQLLAIRLDAIQPDPDQPRNTFTREGLQELSESIRQDGVIQPIEVTQVGPNQYQIVHGERRWRAAKRAGLETIPAIVQRRNYDEVNRFVRQMVENIQREDLNDIDRAHAMIRLRDLMQEELDRAHKEGVPSSEPWGTKITWAKVGNRLSLSRQRVTQLKNLLKLPDEIQESVRAGTLSERDTRSYQGLKPSQQQALHQSQLVGEVTPQEAKQIQKMLKGNPDLTVAQAVRILYQEEPIKLTEEMWVPDEDLGEAVEEVEKRPLPPSQSTESGGRTQLDYLRFIRGHLAQFSKKGISHSDREEIVRLLRLIKQDIDSLMDALK